MKEVSIIISKDGVLGSSIWLNFAGSEIMLQPFMSFGILQAMVYTLTF